MMNKELQTAIIKTIAYFDLFDYPLTLIEIYKWLFQVKASLSEILQALETDELKKQIGCKNGFYFLKGREAIIDQRLLRYVLAETKYRIAFRTMCYLRWLPFIKMIALCNNAGYSNASEKSDIDFFIIVKEKRIWLARLGITALVSLLGVRRHADKYIDRICLSFYLADDHLDISDLAIKPQDSYLIYWLATLAPIYDSQTLRRFFAGNSWLENYLPNFYQPLLNHRRLVADSRLSSIIKNAKEQFFQGGLGEAAEKLAEKVQVGKVNNYIGDLAGEPNTNVVINSEMLKFHKVDRRVEYHDLWQQKINRLGING